MVYTLRGCMFTWRWGNFRPEASSLRFPLMVLHLFTWYHHAGTSHFSVRSPWLLQYGENFTLVQNLATVSSKRETTTRCGVKSVCRWTRTGSACLMFAILNHIFYSHEVYPQITRYKMTQLSCKWDTKSKSHPGINSCWCEFSHVNTPLYTIEITS